MEFTFDVPPQSRQCGVLKNKIHCPNMTELFAPACDQHATAADMSEARLVARAWTAGVNHGRAASQSELDSLLVLTEKLKVELERSKGRPGESVNQIVEIDGRWSYLWAGSPPLKVGETVICPLSKETYAIGYRRPWEGKVTAIGSRSKDHLDYIVRRKSDPR